MSEHSTYQILLPQFEGPFDLLLFFIERDELNIQDIPIHQITKDFLAYIHSLEKMNIEVASEFILVAATLMRIKTKMLLPRKDVNDKGEEIDPRAELVQKLLEYKQYKDILEVFKVMESQQSQLFSRGGVKQEVKDLLQVHGQDGELEPISLFKLYKSFHKVIQQLNDRKQKVEHRIIPYNYTIEEEKEILLNIMIEKSSQRFEEVFGACETKIHAVFIFLAMLELIQQQYFTIEIGEGYNNVWLKA
ncbi:MAG TPA: segregation/condensation protein A [Chitinophagales bacterium]|nr:segregation/condensation protein A [Chitinophagales bacterium]